MLNPFEFALRTMEDSFDILFGPPQAPAQTVEEEKGARQQRPAEETLAGNKTPH